MAGIEPEPGAAHHVRVGDEALVEQRIGDDQHVVQRHRMAGEGQRARRFAVVQADARLEPLTLGVDQRDQRNRCIEGTRGQARVAVEAVFGWGVQHAQRMQRLDAFFFREFFLTEHKTIRAASRRKKTGRAAAGTATWRRASTTEGPPILTNFHTTIT
jgi:hypothetical protein